MNRRNTVSVTPAMGASTVAGAIGTPPSDTDPGTARMLCGDRSALAEVLPELSQYLRTSLF
jgi:hypothetical protein